MDMGAEAEAVTLIIAVTLPLSLRTKGPRTMNAGVFFFLWRKGANVFNEVILKETVEHEHTSSDVSLFPCLSSGQISEFSLEEERREIRGGGEETEVRRHWDRETH